MSTLTLAACAEMIFTDLPFVQRVERIAARGLQVEMWDWTDKDLKELASTWAVFSSMTGYISGNLTDADAIDEFLESARRSVEAAEIIDSPRLNVHGTGLDGDGRPVRPVQVVTPDMWLTARDTLARLAEIGRAAGRVFTLENLNLLVDHAGTPFALARDTRALVRAVDSPHLRMNLDLYHCQIGEGNLIETCRESLPWIGEIQVADVPGRCQPGTGEIDYAGVARGLREMGYEGVVGMEAFAAGDSDAALDDFIAAFTREDRT